MPKIRKKYVATGNLNTDSYTVNPNSVIELTSQTANLSVGTNIVTVASTQGYIPGATLTKTSGSGDFGLDSNGETAIIISVDSPTQFTTSVNHLTAGNINFTVGTPTSLIIAGPDLEYYGINNNIGGFVDRVQRTDGTFTNTFIQTPVYPHTLINVADPGVLQRNGINVAIPRYDSGLLNSNKSKVLQRKNSLEGTLPASSIVTGKRLQSFNDPFSDINIIDFIKELPSDPPTPIYSDSVFGVPLVRIKEPVPNTDPVEYRDINSYYMTTNADLISEGFIKLDSEFYNKKFNISETDIFDSPNEYHNNKQKNRLVDSKSIESVMQQERFQEAYTPFTEDYSTFSVSDDSFHNETIDEEIRLNYDISAQKEIKIVIDFSNDVDLTLLNTKMSFVEDDSTQQTFDEIKDLDYFNFISGDQPISYSSHFLPTAYWNFSKQRWNYLDGKITKLSSDHDPADFSQSLSIDKIPVFSSKEKYRYLGAKYREGKSPYTTPDYNDNAILQDNGSYTGGLFDGYVLRGEPSVLRCFENFGANREEIYSNFETKNFFIYANRPILTTPSFRTDGSFYLDSLQGTNSNKSPISKITGTYGFPYGIKWQPQKEHMLKMSDYISNDFLVEKMIVKGKLTSKGEIAKKLKNVTSGFTEFTVAATNNLSWLKFSNPTSVPSGQIAGRGLSVDDRYYAKEDYSGSASNDYRGYLANNLTFFILNERKGLNVLKNNKDAFEKTHSYYVSESLNLGSTGTNKLRNNILGKSLDNFSGNYETYYPEELRSLWGNLYEGVDLLSVYSNIVPTSYFISSDDYNDLTLKSNFFNKNYELGLFENNLYHRSVYTESHKLDSFYVGSRLKLNVETDKNLFLFLNPVDSADPRSTNAINYMSTLNLSGLSDRDHFYDTREYRTHDIVLETIDNSTEHSLDQKRGRELVTYSNMLLLSKYQNHSFDDAVFANIDETKILTFNEGEDLHINIDDPIDFEVKSFFKNIEKSDYTDETELKLKSNYRKTVQLEEPNVSEWPLQLGPSLNRVFTYGTELNQLFAQYVTSDYQPDGSIVPQINSNNILFEFVNDANVANQADNEPGDTSIHAIRRMLGDRLYEFNFDLRNGDHLTNGNNGAPLDAGQQIALTNFVNNNFSSTIPCTVPSHFVNGTFSVKTDLYAAEDENQKMRYNINFVFSNNKTDGTPLPLYFATQAEIQTYLDNNASSIKLEDFISYSYGDYQRNDNGHLIDVDDEIPIDVDININLRFLDLFRILGNLDKFYNYAFVESDGTSSYYALEELTNLQQEISIGFETNPADDSINIWHSGATSTPFDTVEDLKKKQHNLIKLIYIAFINAPVYWEANEEHSTIEGLYLRTAEPGIPVRSQVWQYLDFGDSPPEFRLTQDRFTHIMLRYKETEFFPSHTTPYSDNGWSAGFIDKQQLIDDTDFGITLEYRDYHGEKAYPENSSVTDISDPDPVDWNLDGHIHFGKEITFGTTSDEPIGHGVYIVPQVEASSQGATAPTNTITNNYNYVGILEGKNLGNPNNLGISSERIINKKEELINTNPDGIILNNAGKILKEKDTENYLTKSNYLLKPEDELVFGVSSNSNGEVLQSVVTLHDKLEITLIGRDYIDTKKVKNNESISIRKVVIGDNLIEKSGQIIQQTEGSYYDSVWNKNSLLNSFTEFSEGKEIIGQTSSGKFGSYTGLITFDRNYSLNVTNNTTSISTVPYYKLDTVHPSLANVFTNCLEKELLYSVDNQDIYRFFEHKKKNNISSISASSEYNIPSYKIVLSDSITPENLNRYENRYNRIVYDWHEKYHLEDYKTFFLNDDNVRINDFSYDVIGGNTNYDSNSFIYFDINSISAGLNYHNWISYYNFIYISNDNKISERAESFSNNSNDDFLQVGPWWYHSLKTYCLPLSKHSNYQNAINLNNNLDSEVGTFKNKDIIIETDTSNRTQASDFVLLNKYSLQYMLHKIEPSYTRNTSDFKTKLYNYGNDHGLLDYFATGVDTINEEYFILKSGWCLVFEVTKSQLDTLVYNNFDANSLEIFERSKKTVQDNNEPNTVVHYYKENIYLDISQNAGDNGLTTKNFKLIKKIKLDNNGIELSRNVTNRYYLVSPLSFWETLEVNMTNQGSNPSTFTSTASTATRKESEIGIFNLYKYINNETPGVDSDLVISDFSSYSSLSLFDVFRGQSENQNVPTDSAWYAKDKNGRKISYTGTSDENRDLYSDFINYEGRTGGFSNQWTKSYIPPSSGYPIKINISGIGSSLAAAVIGIGNVVSGANLNDQLTNFSSTEKLYPYTIDELETNAISGQEGRPFSSAMTVVTSNIYLSFPKFSILDNNKISPVHINNTSLSGRLKNNYLKKITPEFYSKEFFENNLELIDNLNENINNLYLNEKVYKTKIVRYDKSKRLREQLTTELIYKIKDENSYNITSIEGLYNNFTLFKKDSIIEDELLYTDSRNYNLEVYEDSIYENKNYIQKNPLNENNIPYFYIDLESSIIHDKSDPNANRLPLIGSPVFTNQVAAVELVANSNEVKVSGNMSGWYVGSTLTKTDTDGLGQFGVGAVIESISQERDDPTDLSSPYTFTTSVNHINSGAITFTVDGSSQVYNKINEYDKIKMIPYSHYKVDFDDQLSNQNTDNTLNVDIQIDIAREKSTDKFTMLKFLESYPTSEHPYDNFKSSFVNSGSPIYRLKENPDGYYDKAAQEAKICNFFYGFSSKGAHRYPIYRLDGFKYGVENGGKQGIKHYYKNSSYGNFSDRIMGSINYATITSKNGEKIIQRTVEKRFVDSDNGYLYESNVSNINNFSVYNSDIYARSTYPYIENSQHLLSQLHVDNGGGADAGTF